MNKSEVVSLIMASLKTDYDALTAALRESYDTATADENIAENKYDTLGLEASYLVQGQARRSTELDQALSSFQQMTLRKFDASSRILLSALVCLSSSDVPVQWIFIGPQAGGVKVMCGAEEVTVVTPQSPLGRALLGRYRGDVVEVLIAGRSQSFEVQKIL